MIGAIEQIKGKRISIPEQFNGLVTVESAKIIDNTLLLRIRTQQGELRDAYLTVSEAEKILASREQSSATTVDANQFFLFIESARIKTAYEFDPHFAVSLSGVRPLPHQLEKERHTITVPFELSEPEKYLYDRVTKYINRYLGKTKGKKQASVALARTVLQRRLASSLNAIFSSLKKRQKRFADLLEELNNLSPGEQRDRLMSLGKIVDTEQDSDDCDEEELEDIAVESTVVEEIDQLREELDELERLVKLAQETIEIGTERKLNALKECLARAEFDELKDGRGKLLIFTEHRDTLEYLKQNLTAWGYTTCEIHGGMNPITRKQAQTDFRLHRQICLATDAAGEGINLQFCQLMINYDLPWNPNRLEQRMGRIHRIGQERAVYIFNFLAENTVEGRVLSKLLTKLEEIRSALGDRVFDVIGQLLRLNDIQFEDMVREATYGKVAEDEAIEQIEHLDPKRITELEEATGVALATSHIDLSRIRRTQDRDYVSEEQRLMPRYIEEFFKRTCDRLEIKLEPRADGLWRIPYIKEEFRSDNLNAVRRLGTPEKHYSKLTFYKEHLANATHQDAELLSPGHPLFAAIAERLDRQLDEEVRTGSAVFIDADADKPYRLYFFEVQIASQQRLGKEIVLRSHLSAIVETASGELILSSPDHLHDLAPAETLPELSLGVPTPQEQQDVEDWLKVKIQLPLMKEEQQKRQRELNIRQDYLSKAMETAIRGEQKKQMQLAAKVAKGDETYRVARDSAQKRVQDLQERYKRKQTELGYLKLVRPGRVIYLGTALVYPGTAIAASYSNMRNDPEVEAFAMQWVMDYEVQRGWQPEDVSQKRDGSGFDIRSVGAVDPETGIPEVRRIEVKGRAQLDRDVSLTVNEWRKAQQLGDSYWLYVVWGCNTANPRLLTIQNPAKKLMGDAKEIKQVTRYLISAEALEKKAE